MESSDPSLAPPHALDCERAGHHVRPCLFALPACGDCGHGAHEPQTVETFHGKATHVGRFCFGCPECDRLAQAGIGRVRA